MSFDNIRIEKGLYTASGGFSAQLEQLDPSTAYAGTPYEGLDAYQRQLKRFDIKVSGSGSDVVEKFFQTSDSAALFPEYVNRAVKQGMEEANLLPGVLAATTRIRGMDYRSIASVPSQDDKELKDVDEGGLIPETAVHTQENLVRLRKRGRMLVASYEALRFQRLDLFTVTLRQIGAYISRQQFKDAVDVILYGDGNDNAAQNLSVQTNGSLTYDDLLVLWNSFDPYEMNTLLASPDVMLGMLKLDELRDPQTGLNFQGTGKLSTPLGAQLYKSSAVPTGTLIGMDKTCALEMVIASDISLDYDKLIDRQLERAAITSIAGFAKIFTDASKALVL